MKYYKVKPGEWIQPRKKGYKLACCDCGLVHNMDFRSVDSKTGKILTGSKVQFRAFRNERSTGQTRRHKNHSNT